MQNHQLKEENQTLKTQNIELESISQLMQVNMQDTLATSKK